MYNFNLNSMDINSAIAQAQVDELASENQFNKEKTNINNVETYDVRLDFP